MTKQTSQIGGIVTFPTDPNDRVPKGDHNRRLALGMDLDAFATAAGVTPEQLKQYELTLPDAGGFDLLVAQRVGATLERLEANPPSTQRVINPPPSVDQAMTQAEAQSKTPDVKDAVPGSDADEGPSFHVGTPTHP